MLVLLSFAAFADDPLFVAVDAMTNTANTYYPTGSPVDEAGAARLRPSTFYAKLGAVRDALELEGCTVDSEVDNVAGSYHHGRTDGTVGEDADGEPLVATTTAAHGIFGTVGVDAIGGTVGAWANGDRFVIDRGDTFYVGHFARVAGARGVHMGLGVSCPVGTSPETALADWFDGDLTGLDPVATTSLDGAWNVTTDCSDPAVWTFSGGPPTYEVDAPDLAITATQVPGEYVLAGTRTLDVPPFGTFELDLDGGNIVFTGPDAIAIQYVVTAPFVGMVSCTGTGTR
ncbi:MAG: hypothetical protein H6736_23350 [Alphaproteobacteria bacterium]|nr:hypothetical protein [Alphaproteobacteria bacterium]